MSKIGELINIARNGWDENTPRELRQRKEVIEQFFSPEAAREIGVKRVMLEGQVYYVALIKSEVGDIHLNVVVTGGMLILDANPYKAENRDETLTRSFNRPYSTEEREINDLKLADLIVRLIDIEKKRSLPSVEVLRTHLRKHGINDL